MKRNVVKGEGAGRGGGAWPCDLCGMQRGNIMEEREETDLFVVSQSAFKRERMTGEAFNHV